MKCILLVLTSNISRKYQIPPKWLDLCMVSLNKKKQLAKRKNYFWPKGILFSPQIAQAWLELHKQMLHKPKSQMFCDLQSF